MADLFLLLGPALEQTRWDVVERAPVDWLALAGLALGALFSLGVALLLVRSLAQGARYRADTMLGPERRAALEAQITAVEERTSGELAVVVLERSDRHPATHWMSGVLWLFTGSVLLSAWLPWHAPLAFFGVQLALGLAGAAAALLVPGYRRAFVTEERATEVAEEQAVQEFQRLGLHATAQRTGVLLFVSLFERRVVVLGDAGIDAALDAGEWAAVDAAVLAGVRRGDLPGGLGDAVERCGERLAEHFPPGAENPDELPNHVVVRRE